MDPCTQDLLRFLDGAPTPWHAVAEFGTRLEAEGWRACPDDRRWEAVPERGYVVRDGGSLIAWRGVDGSAALLEGATVIVAHTDSPALRLKPRGVHGRDGLVRARCEVYGGAILASFTDRPLRLAGRAVLRSDAGSRPVELPFRGALPQAAVHLNREVNEKGLRLDRQEEVVVLLGQEQDEMPPEGDWIQRVVANELRVEPEEVLAWELFAVDGGPAEPFGQDDVFFSSGRIDNLASCHAAIEALRRVEAPWRPMIVALFNHEEVGSSSWSGAAGRFFEDVWQRLAGSDPVPRVASRLWSVDVVHAANPAYERFDEPEHRVAMNAGPALKINANQRYVSDALGSAAFRQACEAAGLAGQTYVHRSDLPCGSTVGPILAAGMGMPAVDLGTPVWAMHSARESAGTADPPRMVALLSAVAGTRTR